MPVDRRMKKCNSCGEHWYYEQLTHKKHKGKVYVLSQCKHCASKRSKLWALKNAQKRLVYEDLRSTYKGRAKPICAHCYATGVLHRARIDKWTALYHTECIEKRYQSKGQVSPDRKKTLQELSYT